MQRDLNYIPEIVTAECFSCKKPFSLYSVQKVTMNFCRLCGINNRLSELITLPHIIVKIVKYAEKQNEHIDGRLVVDISKLLKYLQKEDIANVGM